MGQVLLVRHGQASWGADDYDVLSESGWEQSRVLGTALRERGVEPSYVVRGGMRRHRETAEAVGYPDATVDPGWDEYDHVGLLTKVPAPWGEGPPPGRREFQAWFEDSVARWTGGEDDDYPETFTAFGDRVTGALQRAVAESGSGTAVVLTSGGAISWVAASLLGADLDPPGRARLWKRLNDVCVNSGVSKVVSGSRGLTFVGFNDHTHLPAGLLTYR